MNLEGKIHYIEDRLVLGLKKKLRRSITKIDKCSGNYWKTMIVKSKKLIKIFKIFMKKQEELFKCDCEVFGKKDRLKKTHYMHSSKEYHL